jgi:hypothetical protein
LFLLSPFNNFIELLRIEGEYSYRRHIKSFHLRSLNIVLSLWFFLTCNSLFLSVELFEIFTPPFIWITTDSPDLARILLLSFYGLNWLILSCMRKVTDWLQIQKSARVRKRERKKDSLAWRTGPLSVNL